MSNYYIIGGDGRQYGPITADEVRKWTAEGRLSERTQARSENDTEWRDLSAFPEFTDLFGFPPAPAAPPVEAFSPASLAGHDYELDLFGCVARGWELLKNNFGVLFVGPLIYFLLQMLISGLSRMPLIGPVFTLANLIITGPLVAGILYQFILVNRGKSTPMGDIFAGFRQCFVQAMLGYLVIALFCGLCFAPFLLVYGAKFLTLIHQSQTIGNDQTAAVEFLKSIFALMLSSMPLLLVCSIPVVYLSVSFIFVLPLIIDQGMDFWPAIRTSHKMVGKHWWVVFGLVVLMALLKLVGFLACCIGLLITIPIAYGALISAYETIFRPPPKS